MATSEPLQRLAKAVPGGEVAAWRAASRDVAGRSRAEALSTTASLLERGHGVGVDLFGELVRDPATADRVVEDHQSLAAGLPPAPADAWLSVDLTHLAWTAVHPMLSIASSRSPTLCPKDDESRSAQSTPHAPTPC